MKLRRYWGIMVLVKLIRLLMAALRDSSMISSLMLQSIIIWLWRSWYLKPIILYISTLRTCRRILTLKHLWTLTLQHWLLIILSRWEVYSILRFSLINWMIWFASCWDYLKQELSMLLMLKVSRALPSSNQPPDSCRTMVHPTPTLQKSSFSISSPILLSKMTPAQLSSPPCSTTT